MPSTPSRPQLIQLETPRLLRSAGRIGVGSVTDPGRCSSEEGTLKGFILVVGPDGAGKTTVLDALEQHLDQTLVREHSRPGVIAGRRGDGSPVTDPHGQRPRGLIASLAKLAVVYLDTLIGTRTRWRRLARRQLLVVERGWFDLVVDPRRYRLPERLAPAIRLLGRTLPRADLTVLLSGDPAVLHARKPEIGEAEVARQISAWEMLLPQTGRLTLGLDTSQLSPEACATAIADALQGPGPSWRRVPLSPRRLAMRATGPGPALTIYRPHRRAATAAARLQPILLRTPAARPTAPPPVSQLEELVARAARTTTQMAAFASSGPDRWVIGLADGRALHTVVKVGPAHDAGLARETLVLSRLRSTAAIELPSARWHLEGEGRRALATAALHTSGPSPSPDLVAELSAALVRGELGEPVVHGDLAPWNAACWQGRVVLWDWEAAELGQGWPLHDLTHYLIRSGLLLGAAGPAEVAAELTRAEGPGARHLAALGLPVASAEGHVRAYLERTVPSSAAEAAYRDALVAALADPEPTAALSTDPR